MNTSIQQQLYVIVKQLTKQGNDLRYTAYTRGDRRGDDRSDSRGDDRPVYTPY